MYKLYRKKPVVIRAWQVTLENSTEVMEWCGAKKYYSKPPMRAITGIEIPTLEGITVATFGDYVICGVKREFYACKPDIFKSTYEDPEKEM